jgi:hypothetical protein
LALRSEEFNDASWGKSGSSISANSTASPSGLVNADTMTADGSSGEHRVTQVMSFTTGLAYTFSFYVKKNTNDFFQIALGGTSFATLPFANFNVNNGTLGSTGGGATSTITSVGNGWFRCTLTATTTGTGSDFVFLLMTTSSTSLRRESNTLSTSVFLWGAQLEAGAYATSYIPTTSASVTRNLDVVQKTGVSSLIGQTEGTIYWEGRLTSGQTDDIFYLNTSVTNSIFLYRGSGSSNTILFRIYYGGSFITIGNATAYTGLIKIAAAYKSGNSVMYINGAQVGTSSSAFAFTGALNDVVLNNSAYGFGNAAKRINTAAIFPTRLTNTQLAALTT